MLTDASTSILVVNSILSVASIVVVALRYQARHFSKQSLSTDDYVITVALFILLGAAGGYMAAAVRGGVGTHQDQLTLETIVTFLKYTFALQFPYIISVTLIKISILLFYRRVFSTPQFQYAVLGMCGLVVAWGVTFFFATLLQTIPISGNWNPEGNADNGGQSIDVYTMYTSAAVLEICLDIITLCMPLAVIWTLKMGTSQKVVVSGIFLLGAFVCVASIVRLYYLIIHLNPSVEAEEDLTYNIANIVVWSSVEPQIGLICACLPTLGPILNRRSLQSLIDTVRSWLSASSGGRTNTDDDFLNTQNRREQAARAFDPSSDSTMLVSRAEGGTHGSFKGSSSGPDLPWEAIHVDRTFNVGMAD